MVGDHDEEVPTPYEGWTITAFAFDQGRDPNRADDFQATYQPGHGRLMAELDIRVDRNGDQRGLIQFLHQAFATDVTSPRLAALLSDASGTVREHQHEQAYLEVEHYEDGYTLFGVLLDADSLDELDRRTASGN